MTFVSFFFSSCRLEDGEGNISWSAPVYFDLIIPGATAEFRHIECCFVIPDGPSLQAFVQARPTMGTGAPVSRGEFQQLPDSCWDGSDNYVRRTVP